MNRTQLVLIPKKSKPESMADLRPIALCKVLYKIATKVLTNQLKPLLDPVISTTQSVFVPGHLITGNIMIAYKINHYLNKKRQGNIGFGALKLDLSKAFDRLEWNYLKGILYKMGFSNHWCLLSGAAFLQRSTSLCFKALKLALFIHREESDKEILYHLICSS